MNEDEIMQENMEFAEENPSCSYFLMITYDVLKDNRLTDFQKILYGAVIGLCHEKGYCYARNEYFEKLFDKKTTTISMGIGKLIELGYLSRRIIYKKEFDAIQGKWIQTKEIAGRQLYPVIQVPLQDESGGILKNQNRGILKNQNRGSVKKLKSIIDNNSIIDNITFTKVNEEPVKDSTNNEKELNNNISNNIEDTKESFNGDYLEDIGKTDETVPQPEQKKKSGGLKPLLDILEERFAINKYPELNRLLNNYLHAYIGCRRLPTEEKWNKMLDDLVNYSTISISGAEGGKFLYKTALQIVEKAINGRNGAPYTEFDNPNIEKEPQFNLNQEFKGY